MKKLEREKASRYLIAVVWAVSIVSAFMIGYAVNSAWFNYIGHQHRPPKPQVNLYIFVETPEGESLLFSGNLITDIGENRTAFSLRGVQTTVKWISLGNASSIDASKTKLDSEYMRVEGTVSDVYIRNGDYAWNVTKKITFTETVKINACGLHWSGTANSDGNLYALAYLTDGSYQEFHPNWNATIIWILTFDCND